MGKNPRKFKVGTQKSKNEIAELVSALTIKERKDFLRNRPDSNAAIFLRKRLDAQFPNGWHLSDVDALKV